MSHTNANRERHVNSVLTQALRDSVAREEAAKVALRDLRERLERAVMKNQELRARLHEALTGRERR